MMTSCFSNFICGTTTSGSPPIIPPLIKKTSINDDYLISSTVLGVGLSGNVCVCHHKNGTKFALKTIKGSKDIDLAYREVSLQYRASNCDHVVKLKDVYENQTNGEKYVYIVMEYMEGGELFRKIKQKTKFTEREAADIMKDICVAIKHLHDMNIAHRDLKPENFLYSKPDGGVLKLADFGFAKETVSMESRKTLSYTMMMMVMQVSMESLKTPCYTPYYAAPEVLGSELFYDKSCDIWSLGVIMYMMLCGKAPFYSSHGKAISPGMKRRIRAGDFTFYENEWKNISRDAMDLIEGCLKTDRTERFSIEKVMASKWIADNSAVPQTPLVTSSVLTKEVDKWDNMQVEMSRALNNMRIETELKIELKSPGVGDSLLAKKRRMSKDRKMSPIPERKKK